MNDGCMASGAGLYIGTWITKFPAESGDTLMYDGCMAKEAGPYIGP